MNRLIHNTLKIIHATLISSSDPTNWFTDTIANKCNIKKCKEVLKYMELYGKELNVATAPSRAIRGPVLEGAMAETHELGP